MTSTLEPAIPPSTLPTPQPSSPEQPVSQTQFPQVESQPTSVVKSTRKKPSRKKPSRKKPSRKKSGKKKSGKKKSGKKKSSKKLSKKVKSLRKKHKTVVHKSKDRKKHTGKSVKNLDTNLKKLHHRINLIQINLNNIKKAQKKNIK